MSKQLCKQRLLIGREERIEAYVREGKRVEPIFRFLDLKLDKRKKIIKLGEKKKKNWQIIGFFEKEKRWLF